MNNYDDMNQKSNMIIYTTEDGLTKIETTFDEDTVWLSIDQMAELFQSCLLYTSDAADD